MPLRRKVFLVALATVSVGFVVSCFFLQFALLRVFGQAEKRRLVDDLTQVVSVIDQTAKEFSERFADWSSWDDSYQFVQDANPEFVKANLNEESIEAMNLNLIMYLDADGKVAHATYRDLSKQTKPLDEKILTQFFGKESFLVQKPAESKNLSGLVLFPEGPLLISSRPLLTSKGEGPMRGTLINGRFLNQEQVQRISKLTGLSVAVRELDPRDQSLSDERPWVRIAGKNAITAYDFLQDIYGKPILLLTVTAPRIIYGHGKKSLFSFMICMIAIGLLFILAAVVLLDRLVLKRLLLLHREVNRIKTSGSPTEHILLLGKDELSNLAGSINGMLEAIARADERKRKLEEQLLQSQKMETVGTLAGGIAHDLNNQLTPLVGYLDLALKELPDDDSRRELLEEAVRSGKRCAEIVQKLLSFSRPSSQKKSFFKIDSLMSELQSTFLKFIPSTVTTVISATADLWPVYGNETEIQTVLMNMAANARDAMPEGGKLVIEAANETVEESKTRPTDHLPGRYVRISVMDTGHGMPPEVLARIFEPFYTTKTRDKGSGLGLSMVFSIVKDHGGWIEVDSQVGKGTTFFIYLPADPLVKIDTGKSAAANGASDLPVGKGKILLVDDEEALRGVGKAYLERLGYSPVLAKDGEEALNFYKKNFQNIDGLVLDMTMPKYTGRQLLKEVLRINPQAKVLLMSGYTSEGSVQDLLQEGASDFIQKPFTLQPFARVLKNVLAK